jgi:diaminohydroxyphosphoribosylaminopyrimidine deaminase/5-amino-6-(5-phosphoribosylamino)uracil reductase
MENTATECAAAECGDAKFMRRALCLARRGCGHTRPNPPVGAVVVKDGKAIGEGWHRKAGGDHAEVAAIKSALKHADAQTLKHSTVYVTLEPCSKPGRVGACCDALIQAGVKRVVYACKDPNPKNAGRAARILKRHGIETQCGLLCGDAWPLVRPFAKFIRTGMPYLTVKIAMTLDGRICDVNGNAKWISSEASRRTTGRLRERVDAVIVGAGTVRADNPSLLSHGKPNRDLYRVVVSSRGIPEDSQVLVDEARDRTIVAMPSHLGGKIDLAVLMKVLGSMGFMHVLCEGGLELARAFADGGLVDEWISVVAPVVLGSRDITSPLRFPGNDAIFDFRGAVD